MYPTGQAARRDVTGARIGAWFIDILILGALSVVVLFVLDGFDSHTFSNRQRAVEYCERWEADNFGVCSVSRDESRSSRSFGTWDTSQFKWLHILFLAAVNLLAYPLVQGLTGATPGKALVGLRVIQRDGQICGVWRSFLRHILWVADAIICGLPIVGGAVMLSTQQKQRVGDLAASTFVVHRTEVGTPIPEQTWGAPPPPMTTGPYGTSGHPGFQPGTGAQGWTPPPVPPAQPGPGSASWGQAPGSPPAGFGAPSAPGSPAGPADGPTWDAARGTYVQYDPSLGSWVKWNDTTKAWEPIE